MESSRNAIINCETHIVLNWSEKCVIMPTDIVNQGATFPISDTKLYVSAVTLSSQENTKLLKKSKSGFKRIINWNKY